MSDEVRYAILGVVGGLIPEVIRYIAALRSGARPSGGELTASGLVGLLGLGVLFFDNSASSSLQVAVLGASFPQLFSGMVAAGSSGKGGRTRGEARRRGVVDYLAWRLN